MPGSQAHDQAGSCRMGRGSRERLTIIRRRPTGTFSGGTSSGQREVGGALSCVRKNLSDFGHRGLNEYADILHRFCRMK